MESRINAILMENQKLNYEVRGLHEKIDHLERLLKLSLDNSKQQVEQISNQMIQMAEIMSRRLDSSK